MKDIRTAISSSSKPLIILVVLLQSFFIVSRIISSNEEHYHYQRSRGEILPHTTTTTSHHTFPSPTNQSFCCNCSSCCRVEEILMKNPKKAMKDDAELENVAQQQPHQELQQNSAAAGEGILLLPRNDTTSGTESSSTSTSNAMYKYDEEHQMEVQLDFAVVGFPKCGTTSLMNLFEHNHQTTMARIERCYRSGSDEEMKKLFQELGELPNKSNSSSSPTLRGFKCPTNIVNVDGLHKMKVTKVDTKLIVGIRHPVRWFESFYNFRIAGYLNGRHNIKPPDPGTLIGRRNTYLQLNTDLGRFELSLMQLGKTILNTTDLVALAERKRRVIQSPFPVFIYAVEQLEDDGDQEEAFRKDLQTYLQVQHPFEKIPRSNAASGRKKMFSYNNTSYRPINICEEQYINIRNELVTNGKGTADWLLNHFVKHPDVMIGGNDDVFKKIVQGFATDPCSLQ
jgi:hypothetical protein